MIDSIICPHCKEKIPFDTGFSFDDHLNMICDQCKKIMFPTTKDAEQQFFKITLEKKLNLPPAK
jgi:hypothetical protein